MTAQHAVYLTDEEVAILATGLTLLAESDPRELVTPHEASQRIWEVVIANPYKPSLLGPLATMLAELSYRPGPDAADDWES